MPDINPTLPHYGVRVFISEGTPGEAFDRQFAELVGLPIGPSYSTDLNAIVRALNSRGYWWHLSHIEATVIPTKPTPGMEGLLSDGMAHDPEGYPIQYTARFPAEHPALSLCEALVRATYDLPDAYAVKASKSVEVWEKEPPTREEMMRYYEAREDMRQKQIERIKIGRQNNP